MLVCRVWVEKKHNKEIDAKRQFSLTCKSEFNKMYSRLTPVSAMLHATCASLTGRNCPFREQRYSLTDLHVHIHHKN